MSSSCSCTTFAHNYQSGQNHNAKYDPTPESKRGIKHFQDSWKPFATRVNPVLISAEMYHPKAYARENTAHQGATSLAPREHGKYFVKTPAHYGLNQMSFMNHQMSNFPGPEGQFY